MHTFSLSAAIGEYRLLILLMSIFGFLLSGCQNTRPELHEPEVELFQPHNVYLKNDSINSIRRVTLLPVWQNSDDYILDTAIEEALYEELLKTLRFELNRIDKTSLEKIADKQMFASNGHIPADLIPGIARHTGAEAVLLVDLTAYYPYQPIRIGWRAKLVEVNKQNILWAFDHLFDAGHPAVAQAARHYARTGNRNPFPLDRTPGILQSPRRFARFSAFSMFSTLPKPQQAELAGEPDKP